RRVRALLLRKRGMYQEALPLLRQALAHYDQKRAFIEAARTQFEVARTLAEDGAATRLVVEALQDACSVPTPAGAAASSSGSRRNCAASMRKRTGDTSSAACAVMVCRSTPPRSVAGPANRQPSCS